MHVGDFVECFVPETRMRREIHCCFGWIIRSRETGYTVQRADGRTWSVMRGWVRAA